MLWGLRKWSARDDLHVQGCLILNQVGLLFPVNHAPMKLAFLSRLRAPRFGAASQSRFTEP